MDQQPKIPTLKDTQKPQVKIKGLGAGLTLVDRLKQFKKKDLAFILAGLGTLFMAPLAEHFMMSPEGGDGQLQQGWGKGSGANGVFGGGGTPYETNNSIASGGAIGGSGDIITPLNVRDPSSLVLGPGAAQQPPAGSIAPPTAPARTEADYKDALAGSAARGVSAAARNAPLPMPKVSLGSMGLRGLGVAGGGTSASSSLAPITGGPGGRADTGGGGLNLVRSNPNFKGTAGPRGSGNPTGLDATKRAGQNAGDAFSRAGGALSALNEAAKETIPTGGAGFGGGGQGGFGPNDKFPGGNGPGGSKSIGESLAFIQAKERMMQDLQLAFEKRKLKDPELLLYGIRNDMIKSIATDGIAKPLGALVSSSMGLFKGDPDYACDGLGNMKLSNMTPMCGVFDPAKPSSLQGRCWRAGQGGLMSRYSSGDNNAQLLDTCYPTGKSKDGTGGDKPKSAVSGFTGGVGITPELLGSADKICDEIDVQIKSYDKGSDGGVKVEITSGSKEHYIKMRAQADQLITARNALIGRGSSGNSNCGASFTGADAESSHKMAFNLLTNPNEASASAGAVPALLNVVSKTADEAKPSIDSAEKSLSSAEEHLRSAETALAAGAEALGKVSAFSLAGGESPTSMAAMNKTMNDATLLTTNMRSYAEEAKKRQAALSAAQVNLSIAAKQNGVARSLADVNTRLSKTSDATKLNTDAAVVQEGEKAPVVNELGEVNKSLEAATEALNNLCNPRGNCTGPVDTAKDPKAVEDAKQAATAVRNARMAEKGFLGGIAQTLNSMSPKGPPESLIDKINPFK